MQVTKKTGRRVKFDEREIKELLLSLFAVLAVLVFGTLGFASVEGWEIFDSFYMTVITLSTVGFQEVHPLSDGGRLFAIMLIFMGVGVATAVLPRVAAKIIEKQLLWVFVPETVTEKVSRLKGHTIICGYGRLAKVAANRLSKASHPLVIIDRDPHRADQATKDGHLVIIGEAGKEETLLMAGIKNASRVISILPHDADNLYVVLTVRELNPTIAVTSRAEDETGEKRLKQAGAGKIISPFVVGGQKIADGVLRPFVTDFIDLVSPNSPEEILIEELRIPETSPLVHKTLREAEFRSKTNIMVAAIILPNGEMRANPSGETRIEASSTLICLGLKKDFAALEKMVVGG